MFKYKIFLTILLVLFSSACSGYFVTQDQVTRTNDSLAKTITYTENLQNQINTINENALKFTSTSLFSSLLNDFNQLVDTSNSHISITNSSIDNMQTQLNSMSVTTLSTVNHNLAIKKINENSQKSYDEINTRLNDLQTQINSNNIDIANQTSLISKNTYSANNNKSTIEDNVSAINNLKLSVLIKTQTVQTTKVLTAGEIQSDFAKNSSNAGLIYKNKNIVLIKGAVHKIVNEEREMTVAGLHYKNDDDKYYSSYIYLEFKNIELSAARKKQKGNWITVNCEYDRYNGTNPLFKNCSVIE